MLLTLAILWAGLGLGCGQSDELVSDAITPPNVSQKRTVLADALVYDETAERVYQVGEAIPYTGNVVWFHENGLLQQETSIRAVVNMAPLSGGMRWFPSGTVDAR